MIGCDLRELVFSDTLSCNLFKIKNPWNQNSKGFLNII